ncbi:MAG: glycoside hydrolase family 99-like domain-containing protein [Sphingobacterium sp.]
MKKIEDTFKRIFWKLPISLNVKKRLKKILAKPENEDRDIISSNVIRRTSEDESVLYKYQILSLPTFREKSYCKFVEHSAVSNNKAKLVAYYLPQFHPNDKNDLWWGRGTTEWTNVSKAVPQYIGHLQPKLPGELGYYDLRLPEIMHRQIELAKNYGISVFSFYYYWFDGERILEKPLDMFIKHKNMNIQFCICWANENWTKRFSGTNTDVLMRMSEKEDSYKQFIDDVIPYLKDERYFAIDDRLVIVIYRPSLVPNHMEVFKYWRKTVKEAVGKQLYIIGSQEARIVIDWTKYGFDAISQFQPGSISGEAKDITVEMNPVRTDFSGIVYDYEDIVQNGKFGLNSAKIKKYPAVMPAWDNTARRNHKGIIYHGSRPELYEKWLKKAINYAKDNGILEEPIIFINAWNEWGEGTYLEPDRTYGYAYLEATWNALNNEND